jgi:hypothetical protein
MWHGLLDNACPEHILCDTPDRSDEIVVVPGQTGSGDGDIVIVAANDAF